MVDTSIYNMIRGPQPLPNPMEQAGQAMQLKALIGQGDMQALQMQQAKEGIARQGRLRDLFARGDVKPEDVMAIDPETGFKFQKQELENRKSEADLMKIDRENLIAFAGESRKTLPTIRTQEQWAAWRDQQIQRAGMFSTPQMRDLALKQAMAIPANFDPNFIRDSLVKAEELYTPKPQQVSMPDGSIKTVDMNPFTNPDALSFQAAPGMTPSQQETRRHNQVMEGQGAARMAWEGIPPASPAPAVAAAPGAAGVATAAPTGGVTAMPGESPKAAAERRAKLAEEAPKAKLRVDAARAKADVVIGAVDEALKQAKNFRWFGASVPGSGLRRSVGSFVPGSDAYDLERTIDTVIGNLGFKELQAMREASPTGGALGQVAVKELEMLQSTIANLKVGQSQEQLEKNLGKVREHFENWKRAVEQDYQERYGGGTAGVGNTPDVSSAARNSMKAGGIKFLGFE